MASLTAVERLKFVLQVDASGAIKQLQQFGQTADKELSKAETKMHQQASSMQKYGAGAMAFAGVAGIALFKLSNKWKESALAAGKFAAATGITVEEASRFIVVAEDLDLESGKIVKAIGKMEKALGKSPDKFAKLGIATKNAAGEQISAQEVFLSSSDVLKKITTESDRASAASSLFGRDWQNMAVMLGKGSTELRKRFAAVRDEQVFSKKDYKAASEYRDALKDVGNSFKSVTLALGEGTVPMFAMFAQSAAAAGDALTAVNRASGGVTGQLLAIGTVGIGVVGTISMIAGTTQKMSQRFKDGDGVLTKYGAAAKGVGIALGAIAVGVMVGTVVNKLTENTKKADDAFKSFIVTADNLTGAGSGGSAELLNTFVETSKVLADSKGYVEKLWDAWGQGMSDNNGQKQIDDISDAFDKLRKEAPATADQMVLAFEGIAASAASGDAAAQKWMESNGLSVDLIKQMRHEVDLDAESNAVLNKQIADQNGLVDDNILLSAKEIEAKKKATKAAQDHAKALEDEKKATQDLYDELLSRIDKEHAYEVQQRKTRQAVAGLNKELADGNKTQDEKADAIESVVEQIKAEARAYAEKSGSKDPKKLIDDQVKSLYIQAAALAPGSALRKNIEGYINEIYQIPGKVTTQFSMERFIGSHYAAGTTSAKAGVALVGEQGPELVMLGGGEHILTAAQTQSALTPTNETSSAKANAVLTEREILEAQFELGEISAKQYKEMLKGRLGTLEKYSSDYMATWREIRSLEKDAEDESQKNLDFAQRFKEAAIEKHLDRIRELYKKAADRRALDDAKDEADAAMRDYGRAMGEAMRVGKDKSRKVTQEDRQNAYDSAVDAGKNAAQSLADRAGAAAVAAGFEEGTPEYARSVRAALLQDQKNAPALKAAIDRELSGIPELAMGGLVTSPTVAMVGEAGPEAVIPLSKVGQMGATYNITVNTAADPNSVVAAIKRYTKNGGVL
jgi:hypothetical protein